MPQERRGTYAIPNHEKDVGIVKKFLMLLAFMFAVNIFPLAAYANDGHHDQGHHDQAWKNHHDKVWKDHERDWKDHDREWREHRNDRRWREEHVKLWHDWYQWHKDNESDLNIHVSLDPDGGPTLDIDYNN